MISFSGKEVYFEERGGGSGPAVIFLHGFCEDSSMWDHFLEPFDDQRILLVDLPGFGRSPEVDEVSIAYMAGAVLAVIDHLGLSEVLLIGHSMGGYVALEIARQRRELLTGLGLFHSHPFADSPDRREGRDKAVAFIEENGHELFVKRLLPTLFSSSLGENYKFLIDTLIHRASRSSGPAIKGALKAMRDREDRSETLQEISCPVLFIIGEEDQAVPLELSLKQTHLPSVSDIHILPEVGHMGMFTAKRKCQTIVKEFIDFCRDFPETAGSGGE